MNRSNAKAVVQCTGLPLQKSVVYSPGREDRSGTQQTREKPAQRSDSNRGSAPSFRYERQTRFDGKSSLQLRLMECPRLRVQDIDFGRNLILSEAATTILPENLRDELFKQITAVKSTHHKDLVDIGT